MFYFSHKQNYSWNETLYDEWRPKIELLVDYEEYLPTQETSIPFPSRLVSAANLFPNKEVCYEHLTKFQGLIQTGILLFKVAVFSLNMIRIFFPLKIQIPTRLCFSVVAQFKAQPNALCQ